MRAPCTSSRLSQRCEWRRCRSLHGGEREGGREKEGGRENGGGREGEREREGGRGGEGVGEAGRKREGEHPSATIAHALSSLLEGPIGVETVRSTLHRACSLHPAVRRGLDRPRASLDGHPLAEGEGSSRPIHLVLVGGCLIALARSVADRQRAIRLAQLAIFAARAFYVPFGVARTVVLGLGASGALRADVAANLRQTVAPPLRGGGALHDSTADGFCAYADPTAIDALCKTLLAKGVATVSGCRLSGDQCKGAQPLLDLVLLRAAAEEARAEHAAGRLSPSRVKSAAVGNTAEDHFVDGSRRGDLICWLDGAQASTPALSALTQWLRSELLGAVGAACAAAPASNNLGAGAAPMLRLESPGTLPPAMLACYPGGGARFEKHIDNAPATPDNRAVTAVLYLNPDWSSAHGGVLRVHPLRTRTACDELQESPKDIEPTLGALALFWSHRVEHEVLPAFEPRYALSLWMSVAPDQPPGWRDAA